MQKMNERTIGERMKAARVRKGLTQEQLAEKLNIERSAVCHYEKDRREPSLAILVEISDILEVSTDYKLKGKAQTRSICVQIVY